MKKSIIISAITFITLGLLLVPIGCAIAPQTWYLFLVSALGFAVIVFLLLFYGARALEIKSELLNNRIAAMSSRNEELMNDSTKELKAINEKFALIIASHEKAYSELSASLTGIQNKIESSYRSLAETVNALQKNTIEAINAEIESSKGQKVAKGQEEAWNKVAKAAGMTRDQLEQYGQSLIDPRSGITFDREKVSWQDMRAKKWDVEEGSYSTFDSFSTGVQLANGKVVTLTVTPILPNGEVLSEEEVNQYIEDNLQGLDSIDDIFKADNGENGKTIVMNAYEGGTEEIVKQAEAAEMAIHSLSDAYETMAADATFDPQSAFGEYGEGWWEGLERIAGDAQDANQALAQ